VLLVLAGVIGTAIRLRSPAAPEVPVLAVGAIDRTAARDSGGLSPLADLLATSLSRLPSMQVLSSARLIEVEQSLARSGTPPSAAEVARRAQATDLLEGAVYRRGADSLVLELRRIDLKSGRVLRGYRVSAVDIFTLVDRATEEIARAADVARPAQGIADVTTGSLIALRLYQEGLQSYYASDYTAARRFFAAAVAEDSTFAMAMWYLGRTDQAMLDPVGRIHFLAALHLASGASERERLLITADVLRADLRSTAVAVAETLVNRYPSDPEGILMLGLSQASSSNANAVTTIRRAMALDSAVPAGRGRACRPCEVYRALTYAYAWEDSLSAAFASAWDFVRLLPNETTAWTMLSEVANLVGDTLTIDSAQRAFERLTGRTPGVGIDGRLTGKIVRGDYLGADTALLSLGAVSNEMRSDLRWYLSISLRNQGRLDAAIALSRDGTLPAGGMDRAWRMPVDSILLSIALFERGDPRFCRRLYRGIATTENPDLRDWPGTAARERTWALTRLAMCRAADGDTIGFERLADSLETIGATALYGRDQRIHHYVRALLWKARGKPEQAAAEFRAAISSPNFGFTRINYELGGLLLQLGRPGDAVAIVQPALRGALDASNLYITRTELHELLAKAWEAAGNADSARAHWRAVERAWRGADPQFHARYEVAKAKAGVSVSR
jgi:tetratricopeptide (TPR) repeat protein